MLSFISFAYHNVREQQLLSSPYIAEYLFRHTRRLISADSRLTFAGVMTSHFLSFDIEETLFTLLPPDNRIQAEKTGILALTKTLGREPDEDWLVVIRPGLGGLSDARLQSFCDALIKEKQSPSGKKNILAQSLVEHNQMTNPFWNLKAAPRRFRVGNELRLPRIKGISKDRLDVSCPEMYEAIGKEKVARSQDAPSVYFNDGSLYAVKLSGKKSLFSKEYQRIKVLCSMETAQDVSVFYRLPAFCMNQNEMIDCSSLEALCKKMLDDMQ